MQSSDKDIQPVKLQVPNSVQPDVATLELVTDSVSPEDPSEPSSADGVKRKGKTFWLILFALVISFFMVCMEGSGVGNALPTIANDLHISQFSWVGITYGVASTAWLPLSGGLAQVFGRRPIIIASLGVFAAGAAVSGAASSGSMLFAGRTISGLGAGGVLTLSSIILSDIVALHERGLYNGILGLAWSVASGVGPVIGGTLAETGEWRWLFYMNIPCAAVSAVLCLLFVKLPSPPGNLLTKLQCIDWIGNAVVIGSTVAVAIGLTWGGIEYSWTSAKVLVPLVLGIAGLCLFLAYEACLATYPLVPTSLLRNRTTISGYVQTGLLSMPLLGLMYYLPVYYQACKLASPIASGIDVFGVAYTTAPMTVVSGAFITSTKRYRGPIWLGWALVVIGHGLLSTLKATSSRGLSIGYQIITGTGIGLVYSSTYFPVLAPLPVTQNAAALAFYVFARSFAQIWGVTIGGSVLQNQLLRRLPQQFIAQFPAGAEVAYSAILEIPGLPEPLRSEVQQAFAGSLAVIWRVQLIVSVIGFIASLFMCGLPLHTQTDHRWDAVRKD